MWGLAGQGITVRSAGAYVSTGFHVETLILTARPYSRKESQSLRQGNHWRKHTTTVKYCEGLRLIVAQASQKVGPLIGARRLDIVGHEQNATSTARKLGCCARVARLRYAGEQISAPTRIRSGY